MVSHVLYCTRDGDFETRMQMIRWLMKTLVGCYNVDVFVVSLFDYMKAFV